MINFCRLRDKLHCGEAIKQEVKHQKTQSKISKKDCKGQDYSGEKWGKGNRLHVETKLQHHQSSRKLEKGNLLNKMKLKQIIKKKIQMEMKRL